MFKHKLKTIRSTDFDEQKLMQYQTASIMRWAILEGSAFAILLLKKEFILFGILIIIYLILIKPTEDNIKRELNRY